MSKVYSYYTVGPNDLRVSPTGGLVVDKSIFERKTSDLKDEDISTLWAKVTERRSKYNDGVTGCGATFNDPVNDCTYVWWGNYYTEDLGVFYPMFPAEHDRAEHIGSCIVPKSASYMD